MTLGQRIQELRKGIGLSQEELGERMGVSRQAVSKWEGDQTIPELDKLIGLSKLFGLPVGQLLGVEQPVPPPVTGKPSRRQKLLLGGISAVLLALLIAVGTLWGQVQDLALRYSAEEEYVAADGVLFQTAECKLSEIDLGFPQARGTQDLTLDFTLKPVEQLKGWSVIGLTAQICGHDPWGEYPDGTPVPDEKREWRETKHLPASTAWGTSRASLTIPNYGGEWVAVTATLREEKTGRTIDTSDCVFTVSCEIARSDGFLVRDIQTTAEPGPPALVPKSVALALPDPRFES